MILFTEGRNVKLSVGVAWHTHSRHQHQTRKAEWELIGEDSEEMAKIRAAERDDIVMPTRYMPSSSRCLLCRPRVGDEQSHSQIGHHLVSQ